MARRAFSLVELLVVVAILALLIGILLPGIQLFRQRTVKVVCASNLRQVGVALRTYADDQQGAYPTARYMPEPFLSATTDPPITAVLEGKLGAQAKVYRCPGDVSPVSVFELSGTSYQYMSQVSGQRPEEAPPIKAGFITLSELVVMRDFDGGTFDVTSGQVTVPFFHDLRNLLFADGHAGNFP